MVSEKIKFSSSYFFMKIIEIWPNFETTQKSNFDQNQLKLSNVYA